MYYFSMELFSNSCQVKSILRSSSRAKSKNCGARADIVKRKGGILILFAIDSHPAMRGGPLLLTSHFARLCLSASLTVKSLGSHCSQ